MDNEARKGVAKALVSLTLILRHESSDGQPQIKLTYTDHLELPQIVA
jgi:hypothetical protein